MTSEQYFAVMLAIVPAIISAYVAARLSVRAAIHSHVAERWWERKEKAYTDIIEAVYDAYRYSKHREREFYEQRDIYEESRRKEISDAGTAAYWTILRATAVGDFLYDEKVAAELVKLRAGLDAVDGEQFPGDIFSDQVKLYDTALNNIRALARDDLRRGQA